MMKKCPLISSLFITLFILLGYLNTASEALKCYSCPACEGSETGKSVDCTGPKPTCWSEKIEKGGKTTTDRRCLSTSAADLKCSTDEGSGEKRTRCFCNTDLCNGSIQLGPMSLSLSFTLSILMPWVSRVLFFATGHTSN